jgi:plastocyanin
LAVVVAIGLVTGCNANPAPATPSGTSPPPPAKIAKVPPGPRITGTLTANTGDPWTGGGVVYLEDAPKQPGVATTTEIDIHNKVFTPFIAVVTTSAVVTFGNRDALTHHVFSPDVPNWDTGYLHKNETTTRRFDTPGAVALLCNIHPEMVGYLLVIPSTYFGKVGADGKYVIPSVPPGTYKATAWVPRQAAVTQSVVVGPAGATLANFAVPPSG